MKFFEFQDENCRGRIERFEYTGAEGARKYALVYLPFGYYDEPERRYDILYMMHGGGGSPDAWLDSCPFKNMLDRSIAAGEAKPMIVVFPSFYKDKSNRTADGGISGTYWPSDVKKDARTKDTLKRFESVYVGNDSLQELMQAHPKVTFKVDTTSTSFLETVLVSVVPTLLLVGVFIYFMRRISEQNN